MTSARVSGTIRAMLVFAIVTVSLVAAAACGLIALVRRTDRRGDLERLLDRNWWPRFERQFAEYVERLSEGRT